MKTNPGGSLGDVGFPMPEFNNRDKLIEFMKMKRGYDYSNNFAFLDYLKNRKVAELGCGHGYITFCLYDYVTAIDGFDVDQNALLVARELMKAYGLDHRINFTAMESDEVPAESDSYDCVLSADVIEHVQNPFKYLSESYRILRKGGRLLISTPNGLISKKNACIIKSHSPYHITEYYPNEILEMAGEIGFSLEESFSKISRDGIGYRLNLLRTIKIRLWCLLGRFSQALAFSIFNRLMHDPNNADSCENYYVKRISVNEITKDNCDVMLFVFKK